MAVRTAQEIQLGLLSLVGDRVAQDEFVEIFGDISDSVGEAPSQEAIQSAVDAKDKEWRQKFVERFTKSDTTVSQLNEVTNAQNDTMDTADTAPQTYEDIYKALESEV